MPLEAFLFPDHHADLVLDDSVGAHHGGENIVDHVFSDAALPAWPPAHPSTRRLRPWRTALKGAGGGGGGDVGAEEDRSLMEIEKIGLPERTKLDDLSDACKFDAFTSVFGDAEGATRSAKGLGTAIAKSTQCAESTSDMVFGGIFGQKMNPTTGGMGVSLAKTHDIPLGSLEKKAIKATQTSCEDFSTFLLRRFEKPGQKPKCAAAGAVGGLKFTSQDAHHALKSYGLCLDSIGETAALQGCEMGDLQHNGSRDAAHLCKVVEGPLTPGIQCTIL